MTLPIIHATRGKSSAVTRPNGATRRGCPHQRGGKQTEGPNGLPVGSGATIDDVDGNEDDGDDDDDERRLARHAHVVGASAAATTAELRGCLPRRTAPGGLQRLRHPTSPAILHRACASKAAYTPPPTLSLPFSSSFSLSYFIPHSRVSRGPSFCPASRPSPSLLPRPRTLRGAHTSICRIRVSRLSPGLFREGKRGSIPRPPFQPSPPAHPLRHRISLCLSFLCRMFARTRSLQTLFIYSVAPTLRGFVSVISTMETRGELYRTKKSSISVAWYSRKLNVSLLVKCLLRILPRVNICEYIEIKVEMTQVIEAMIMSN